MFSTEPCDARGLANYFLDASMEIGGSLSITSLLKIIYFAHGWHLAEYGTPLIGQPFEAWQHGPVVRVVYDCFKSESGDQIRTRAKKLDPKLGKYVDCPYSFSVHTEEFLRKILKSYSKHHPFKLSDMTHEADSPWSEVWNRSDSESTPGMRISNNAIKNYFLKLNAADVYRV